MTRALDWLRAAIGALLETCMRRLRLVGWRRPASFLRLDLAEAPRAPFAPSRHRGRLQQAVVLRASISSRFLGRSLASKQHWHGVRRRGAANFRESTPQRPPRRATSCKTSARRQGTPQTPSPSPRTLLALRESERDRRTSKNELFTTGTPDAYGADRGAR